MGTNERDMYMNRNSKGYLTVEATITLTVFLFFMLFIMNFAQIYQVQNYVNHGLLQTGKMLAFNSLEYDRENILESAIQLIQDLGVLGEKRDSSYEIEQLWKKEDYGEAVKKGFSYCASVSPDVTYDALVKYGVMEGVDSLDFSGTTVEDDKLIINVSYEIHLPYVVFNIERITLHQRVVCGLWK